MSVKSKFILGLSITGFVLFILSFVFGYAVFPTIIENEVEKQVRLEDGTKQFDRWITTPFPLSFKIYFFNVLNPENVTQFKAKPIVEERGPYVYKLHQQKQNITRNEEDETLSYVQLTYYEWDQEASGTNTPDDFVTILNVPLNAFVQTIEDLDPNLMGELNVILPEIFPDTETLFHTVKASDYIFNGYRFCDPETVDPAFLGVCALIKMQASETIKEDENGALLFSFFGENQNGTDGVYTISSGMDKIKDLGYIRQWEGKTKLGLWGAENSACNEIKGRDATIYPPFSDKDDYFDIFSTDICRVVKLEYVREQEYKGVTGHRREFNSNVFGFYDTEENACYCVNQTRGLDGEKSCAPQGFLDLYPCFGAPALLSFPHMWNADQTYASTVEGMDPRYEDHMTYITIEPGTGYPILGSKRVQINMIIRPIENLEVTQNVEPAVVPIFWMDEAMVLPDHLIQEMKDEYLNILTILDVVQWVLFGVGLALFLGCGVYYYKLRKNDK